MLPAEVFEILGAETAEPGVGVIEPMFPLLTIDADGYPWPCYLSRRELTADADTVWIAVRSRRVRANLGRSPRAALIVAGTETAYTCRLTVTELADGENGVILAALRVDAIDSDGVGTALQAMGFAATQALVGQEAADDHSRILTRFAGAHRDRTTTTARRPTAREVASQ